MCGTYNVARNTERWPMVVFFLMLNMAGINSRIILLFKFIKLLTYKLTSDHLQQRSALTVGIPKQLQLNLKRFRPSKANVQNYNITLLKRKQCRPCSVKKPSITQYKCKKCIAYL